MFSSIATNTLPASSVVAWTIAGSDSSAGAGIQADLKTMAAFSVWGASIITALTAQNTQGVSLIEPVSPEMLAGQFASLKNDLPPLAIKTGMLYDATTARTVMDQLSEIEAFLLVDPVLVATSGDTLASAECLQVIRDSVMPKADLITPNLFEAQALTGLSVEPNITAERVALHMEQLAKRLLELGAKAIYLKGGHCGGTHSRDFYLDRRESFWLSSPRQAGGEVHGSGCTLSAAIVSALARGCPLKEALVIAKAFINQCWRMKPSIGRGKGPLSPQPLNLTQSDLPRLTTSMDAGGLGWAFEKETDLGFYPIVDSSDKIPELLAAGVTTMQLRIKDVAGYQLDHQIERAIALTKPRGCRLYINDYWTRAIAYGAYGVHLGQEDLEGADLKAIASAGLRLGVSTHCHWEIARALAAQPSYIAIGPVHATTTKVMKFAPLGADGFAYYHSLLDYPCAGIGGITLENAPELLARGATGLAVVRGIAQTANPGKVAAQWVRLMSASAHAN
jgi:hydroxymethylpyrimidine kinase / phosphomethylpyrimidine kinase / thiamine-phosphate diphosphorylase